jgi:hypothetical protein
MILKPKSSVMKGHNAVPLRVARRFEAFANHGRSEGRAGAGYVASHVNRDGAGRVISSNAVPCGDVRIEAKNERVNVLLTLRCELSHDRRAGFLDIGLPLVDRVLFPVHRFLLRQRELPVYFLNGSGVQIRTGVILFGNTTKREDVNDAPDGVDVAFVVTVRDEVVHAVRINLFHQLRGKNLPRA